jgi:cephalosporin-C deacetylase-like acetyl esterase
MLTRRNFLQVQAAGVAFSRKGPWSAAGFSTPAQDSAQPATADNRDYWNDWPTFLAKTVRQTRARRLAEIDSIHTPSDMQARQVRVRARCWDLIGGPLEKSPLNARTEGILRGNGYKVERVIFESLPQVFVTANLYLPDSSQPHCCGILSPLGHYWEGKLAPDYQCLYQHLARAGYIVLAFDPFGQGERQQFLDPKTSRSLYHQPTDEHDAAGRPLILLGTTFAQYRVWDAIRALDYLASRSEVDPARIGCVGHSGGATLTMYLCALEPRIQVAVAVEGHFRNFGAGHYDAPGSVDDAEQNIVGASALGIDRADLLAAFAPKPLLMCYTPQDVAASPFYLESVEEVFGEVRAAYSIFGAEDRVRLYRAFLPHRFDLFNRRETYAWLNRWLAKRDFRLGESQPDQFPPAALRCTSTGQVLTSLGGRSVVQLRIDQSNGLTRPMQATGPSRQQRDHFREQVRAKLRELLAVPPGQLPVEARTLSSCDDNEVSIEEFELRSEEQIRIPGWFVKPRRSHGPLPTLLYVSETGKDTAVESSSELQVVARGKGYALCSVGQRGFGHIAPRYPSSEPYRYYDGGEHLCEDFAWASLVLGRPALGQRVGDFARCLDYLASRPEVDRGDIRVLGVRGGALTALLGSVLDERPRSVLCEGVLADFRSVVASPESAWGLTWFVSGLLREFDLPDLIGASAPSPRWFFNVVGPRDDVLAESELKTRFKTAITSYSSLDASDKLRMFVGPETKRFDILIDWLDST